MMDNKFYQKALQREKSLFEYYTNLAKKMKNESCRVILAAIGKEEEKHVKRIEQIMKAYDEGTQGQPDFTPLYYSETNPDAIQALLKEQAEKKDAPTLQDNLKEETDVLLAAARMEENGGAFYLKAASNSENYIEKKFMTAMAIEEMKHMETLLDTYLYLKDPDSWLARG